MVLLRSLFTQRTEAVKTSFSLLFSDLLLRVVYQLGGVGFDSRSIHQTADDFLRRLYLCLATLPT